jgi:hypothetical protein
MKAKLIKTEVNYLLKNEEGVIIASTSIKKGISSLSKQNCDELFEIVTPESMMKDILSNCEKTKEGFVIGFQMAMELSKDKLFTLEQVHKLLRLVHILPNFELEQFEDENNVLQIDTFISHHIQQPTEIDVEICTYVDTQGHTIDDADSFNTPWFTMTGISKLDSEGCLILKRVI